MTLIPSASSVSIEGGGIVVIAEWNTESVSTKLGMLGARGYFKDIRMFSRLARICLLSMRGSSAASMHDIGCSDPLWIAFSRLAAARVLSCFQYRRSLSVRDQYNA